MNQRAFFNGPNARKSHGFMSRQYAGCLSTSHSMIIISNSVGHMHPGHAFSELAQRAQDQQTAMLCEVLKYAANSPDVLLCDFHILVPSKKEHVLSSCVQVGVAQWIRQQPIELSVRWDTPTCASMELPSQCLRFFMTVAVRSPINIRKRVPAVFASYTLGIYIYVYTGYVNLCFVSKQQKIKIISTSTPTSYEK